MALKLRTFLAKVARNPKGYAPNDAEMTIVICLARDGFLEFDAKEECHLTPKAMELLAA